MFEMVCAQTPIYNRDLILPTRSLSLDICCMLLLVGNVYTNGTLCVDVLVSRRCCCLQSLNSVYIVANVSSGAAEFQVRVECPSGGSETKLRLSSTYRERAIQTKENQNSSTASKCEWRVWREPLKNTRHPKYTIYKFALPQRHSRSVEFWKRTDFVRKAKAVLAKHWGFLLNKCYQSHRNASTRIWRSRGTL